MEQQPNKQSADLPLAAVERGLFAALLVLHKRIMTLLRESALDDEKMKVVSKQVMLLIDNATAEMKRTDDMDLQGRLESVYEQAKRLVDNCSKPQGRPRVAGYDEIR